MYKPQEITVDIEVLYKRWRKPKSQPRVGKIIIQNIMKRKLTFIILTFSVFCIGIILFHSCEKAKEIIEAKYKVSFITFNDDTLSFNPFIRWSIDPLPPGDLNSVLRIAKMNEGESAESALEKNGKDYTFCNGWVFQYLCEPTMDSNTIYACQVSVMSNSDLKEHVHYGTSAVAIIGPALEPVPWIIFDEVWIAIADGLNGPTLYITFKPNYTPFNDDVIEWKFVEVPGCPRPCTDAPSHCQWESHWNRLNAISSATYTNVYPDPKLLAAGTHTIAVVSPPVEIPTYLLDPIECGSWPFVEYLISLKSNSKGITNTYYIQVWNEMW